MKDDSPRISKPLDYSDIIPRLPNNLGSVIPKCDRALYCQIGKLLESAFRRNLAAFHSAPPNLPCCFPCIATERGRGEMKCFVGDPGVLVYPSAVILNHAELTCISYPNVFVLAILLAKTRKCMTGGESEQRGRTIRGSLYAVPGALRLRSPTP